MKTASRLMGFGVAMAGMVSATVAEAATRPAPATISAQAGDRLGQGAVARVRRAGTGTKQNSQLLSGLPLLFLGAAVVTVVAVVVVTGGKSSTPQS